MGKKKTTDEAAVKVAKAVLKRATSGASTAADARGRKKNRR